MLGECHAHALMNGINYRVAGESAQRRSQRTSCPGMPVRISGIRSFFVRDGGDPYGVAMLASRLCPEVWN